MTSRRTNFRAMISKVFLRSRSHLFHGNAKKTNIQNSKATRLTKKSDLFATQFTRRASKSSEKSGFQKYLDILFVTCIIIYIFTVWHINLVTEIDSKLSKNLFSIPKDIKRSKASFGIDRVTKKRVVFYSTRNINTVEKILLPEEQQPNHIYKESNQTYNSFVRVNRDKKNQQKLYNPNFDSACVPMKEWQVQVFPTCNNVHEMDLAPPGQHITSKRKKTRRTDKIFGRKVVERQQKIPLIGEAFSLFGKGWFRDTWKASREFAGKSSEMFVLKTLRLERDYSHEFYELHRRDSVALERLTHSPYVLNIYGFCGQTLMQEFADFIDGFHDFESFARQLRNKNDRKILKLKLQIATMIAIGVTHIHEINGPNNATIAHYDINPKNIAVTKGGIPKLNDFNVAEFIHWDRSKKERCGFRGRFHEPWWRAPEEMIMPNLPLQKNDYFNTSKTVWPLLNEKVDVYSLGNILFILLTGYSPRGKGTKERQQGVKDLVKAGIPPEIPTFYLKSEDPVIVAMLQAIRKCFQPDPKKRNSSRVIANHLLKALNTLDV